SKADARGCPLTANSGPSRSARESARSRAWTRHLRWRRVPSGRAQSAGHRTSPLPLPSPRTGGSMESVRTALASLILALSVTAPAAADAEMSFLDNGVIRLGVDLAKGGTITYLSQSIAIAGLDALNVVNSFDLGREVQQSYYSGPDNYLNPTSYWTNWSWN